MEELKAKAEALAATLGTDVHKLWDEFEAFVKKELEGKTASTAADETQNNVGEAEKGNADSVSEQPKASGDAQDAGDSGSTGASVESEKGAASSDAPKVETETEVGTNTAGEQAVS